MLAIKKEGIIIEKTAHAFEDTGVLNPAAIRIGDDVHIYYRAVREGNFSTIGYCRLAGPLKLAERYEHPFMIPESDYELQGMEDPRVVKIDDTYFMTYTAYNGTNACGALATSKDLKTFERHGIITPSFTYSQLSDFIMHWHKNLNEKYLRFYKLYKMRGGKENKNSDDINKYVWDKDVTFFPRKINGKFAFLHRLYPSIQIVYFNEIEEINEKFWIEYLLKLPDNIVLDSKYPFEASYIGAGCPPIETEDGWLLIYHGVEDTVNGYVYHAAAALMDINDPTIEISRLKKPLFSPGEDWEKNGYVNNVVFPTGAALFDDDLYIYYGAADSCIGVASMKLNSLLQQLKDDKK